MSDAPSSSFTPPTAAKDAAFNRPLLLLVFSSLLVFAAAVVLRLGIGATDYDTTDRLGNYMGFNDPLHAEHYAIIIRNFRPADFLRLEHAYDWLLLAMQLTGAGLLLAGSRVSVRTTRWFFAVQGILFPLGLALFWFPPVMFFGLFSGPMDREGFIDLPFIPIVGQSTWVLTSLILLFALRGPGLGLSKVWSALRAGVRAGSRTFVEAVR